MPLSVLDIPPELQLSVFGSLEDLDDALYFSQTCKTLRSLFAHAKKSIERAIIVRPLSTLALNIWLTTMQTSSHVYEHDLCLSKLNEMREDLAQVYRVSGNDLPEEKRPKGHVLVKCLESKRTHGRLAETSITDIALRWQQLRYLRELYLDDLLSKEFDLFRSRFASESLSEETRAAIYEPGIIKSSDTMSRLERSRGFDRNFKARFHKSLCLHSIAIISRSIAETSRDQLISSPSHTPRDEDIDEDAAQVIADTVGVLWDKGSLDLGSKLDCLEVFDFLYIFLMRKLLPLEQLNSWTEENLDDWPYERVEHETEIESWYSFIGHAEWHLQPVDIVDLIKERAISGASYPRDKSLHMRVRGMFDVGDGGGMDWYTGFERDSMVDALRSGLRIQQFENIDRWYRWWDRPRWWDQVRLRSGRPFEVGFQSKYLSEILEYEQASHVKGEP